MVENIDVKAFSNFCQQAIAELSEKSQIVTTLDDANKKLKEEKDSLEKDIENLKAKLKEKEDTHKKLLGESLQTAQQRGQLYKKALSENNDLKKKLDKLEKEQEEVHAELKEERHKVSVATDECKKAYQEYDKIKFVCENLKRQITTETSKLNTAETEKRKASEEFGKIKSQWENLKRQIAAETSKLNTVETEKKKALEEYGKMKSLCEDLKRQITTEKSKLNTVETEKKKALEECDKRKTQVEELKHEIAAATSKWNNAETEKKKALEDFEKLKSECDTLRCQAVAEMSKLNVVETQKNKIKEECEKVKSEYADFKLQFTAEISKIKEAEEESRRKNIQECEEIRQQYEQFKQAISLRDSENVENAKVTKETKADLYKRALFVSKIYKQEVFQNKKLNDKLTEAKEENEKIKSEVLELRLQKGTLEEFKKQAAEKEQEKNNLKNELEALKGTIVMKEKSAKISTSENCVQTDHIQVISVASNTEKTMQGLTESATSPIIHLAENGVQSGFPQSAVGNSAAIPSSNLVPISGVGNFKYEESHLNLKLTVKVPLSQESSIESLNLDYRAVGESSSRKTWLNKRFSYRKRKLDDDWSAEEESSDVFSRKLRRSKYNTRNRNAENFSNDASNSNEVVSDVECIIEEFDENAASKQQAKESFTKALQNLKVLLFNKTDMKARLDIFPHILGTAVYWGNGDYVIKTTVEFCLSRGEKISLSASSRNEDICVISPIEQCIANAYLLISRNIDRHIFAQLLDAVDDVITKAEAHSLYGYGSMCQVYALLCRKISRRSRVTSLCYRLLKHVKNVAPYVIACIAAVWPEAVDFYKLSETRLLGDVMTHVLYQKPEHLSSEEWNGCTNILRNVCKLSDKPKLKPEELVREILFEVHAKSTSDLFSEKLTRDYLRALNTLAVHKGRTWAYQKILEKSVTPYVADCRRHPEDKNYAAVNLLNLWNAEFDELFQITQS